MGLAPRVEEHGDPMGLERLPVHRGTKPTDEEARSIAQSQWSKPRSQPSLKPTTMRLRSDLRISIRGADISDSGRSSL